METDETSAPRAARDPNAARDDGRRPRAMQRVTALLWEGHSLRTIARRRNTPTFGTLARWLIDDRAFRETYKRIRWAQRSIAIEEVLATASDPATTDADVVRTHRAARAWRTGLEARAMAIQAEEDARCRRQAEEWRERREDGR